MPRPSVLSEEKKDQLVQLYKAGTPIPSLATDFKVSVPYVYKLLAAAHPEPEEPKTAPETRKEIMPATCEYCGHKNRKDARGRPIERQYAQVFFNGYVGFQRYEGEEHKKLCSQECYDDLKAQGHFGHGGYWQSVGLDKEAQWFKQVMDSNAQYFLDDDDLESLGIE